MITRLLSKLRDIFERAILLRKMSTPRKELRMLVGPFSSFKKYEMDAKKFIDTVEKLIPCPSMIKVLDVGSGSGRLTFELFSRRPLWQYCGFDIIRDLVNWSKSVGSKLPGKFSFTHSDIYNSLYNPNGKIQANKYKFQYNDNSFSLVFVQSVFTHMKYVDIKNYLIEIERVLKPKGICICTFFSLNSKSRIGIEKGKSSFRFAHKQGLEYLNDIAFPEAAVAYDEMAILKLFENSNLKLDNASSYQGSWFGENGLAYQDIFVIRKL